MLTKNQRRLCKAFAGDMGTLTLETPGEGSDTIRARRRERKKDLFFWTQWSLDGSISTFLQFMLGNSSSACDFTPLEIWGSLENIYTG